MSLLDLSKHFERKTRKQCAKIIREQEPEDITMALVLESLAQFLESEDELQN